MNINSDEDSNSLFNNFLENSSSISYVASGTGGIGLEVINESNTDYTILSTNNEVVVCTKIFIKLIPILNVEPIQKIIDYSPSSITINESVTVWSSSSTQFITEVNRQNIIYKKSNSLLEPICPPIINAQIHDNDNAEKIIDLLITIPDNNIDSIKAELLSILKQQLKPTGIQLGVIAMGFTTNYISLHNAIQTSPTDKIYYFKKLAVYELLRLYDLGYLHGDFSTANILINPDYIYTEHNKGRAMLIDFGATFPVPPTTNPDLSIKDKIDIMLDTRVPYLNDIIPRTAYRKRGVFGLSPNNWSWLEPFNKTTVKLNEISGLIISINNHISSMNEAIKTKYPDIYTAVIEYNNDLDYIYVGGNASTVVVSPLTRDITTSNTKSGAFLKNDIADIDTIFNPNSVNIQDIKTKYLHTLHMGRESIMQINQINTKIKNGGNRKTRIHKRKRRKCKNKTKRKKRK